MLRDKKSIAVDKQFLSVPKGKENVVPVATQQKSLGAVAKQSTQKDVAKKARPRLVSIENVHVNFQSAENIRNLSPTLKAFSDARFSVFSEESGAMVVRVNSDKKLKNIQVSSRKRIHSSTDQRKVHFDLGEAQSKSKDQLSCSKKLDFDQQVNQVKDEAEVCEEVFCDGNLAAGYVCEKTPIKTPSKVDSLTQKSKFRYVKYFFEDEEHKKSPEKVKKVLKRRMSEKFTENLAQFETNATKEEIRGRIKSTVVFFPVKRVQELKDQDKKLKETPDDTKGNLPPIEKVKKVRLETPKVREVKKVANSSFFSETSMEYALDHLRFFELKECHRKYIPINKESNVTSTQRQILIKHLINVNRSLNYPSFFTYNAVRLLDDVFSLSQHIPVEKLQLFELTSLWIVLKKDHIFHRVPLVEKIANLSGKAYDKKEIIKCEYEILALVNFDISYIDVASTVNLCILSDPKLENISSENIYSMYYISGYMIDVSLFNEDLMKESSMLLASTIADLAVVLHLSTLTSIEDISMDRWIPSYGKCFPEEDRRRVRTKIMQQVMKSFIQGAMEFVVFIKYKRSRYGAISKLLSKKLNGFATEY